VAWGSQAVGGARMLGHPREALHLATAGRHGLTRAYSPACAADLWALQARAHGALGESREAAHAAAQSEAAFERIQRADEPEWANRALDLAVTVKSSRCTTAISDFQARIQPFHTVAVARDFDERARLALAASHQP
jgi:hypothetical protein